MSITSTVLVFVAIPAAIIGVVYGLTFAGSDRGRRDRRYRPGRPYDFQPIWFLAAPERVSPAPAGRAPQALESGVLENAKGERVLPGPVGGASDRW
ncbi:hypothetical protein EV385_4365 [Krasilnikovia cinnamomea]|uniref:Uncharacterized protein n=1 Tax=Krasilnikovia cinnamomea TaxID=349313 RepID=A0A4Q7ZQ61_9ACTN|nr:hypothetical protein [Krasilnikovia cinnamomea]RZU52499.1 hypothetical protein EV385_4365 [Krasilnikovia cinnamomea]